MVSVCVSAQIKEAVLSGIALEDDKREEFNKIEQVCLKLLTNKMSACLVIGFRFVIAPRPQAWLSNINCCFPL